MATKEETTDNVSVVTQVSATESYDFDNRILFEDGRLYITKTPCVDGKPTGLPELVDVTEEVADILRKVERKRSEMAYQKSIVSQLNMK